MIDTHVNLHHHLYENDLIETIERANAAGINGMLTICDRFENADLIYKIVQERDNFWASVGAHPHEAKDHLALSAGDLVEFATKPKIIGIGETGLDYHYNLSPRDEQISVFETHIEAAQICQLPLIVHTRNADDDMAKLLTDAIKAKPFPLLMHCYTSSPTLLKACLDMDAFVSISGIATFKAAQDVRDNIQYIPPNKLLVETDCPYLAPVPMRGKRNEPAFLPHLVSFLSEFLNEDTTNLAQRLDDNFFSLFSRAKGTKKVDL